MDNALKIALSLLGALVAGLAVAAVQQPTAIKLPEFKQGAYLHNAPDLMDIKTDPDLHPDLRKVILKGRDMFMNTQKYRGEYVFNDMNCKSCHMGEGRLPWAAPVWPAVTTLPDFRGKNKHVNSLQERIAGCFAYSMNGKPPAYGSDDMLALVAYHTYMAKGAEVYNTNIAGRGFNHLGTQMPEDISYDAGQQVYTENCAVCHGNNGEGKRVDGEVVFPALWGDDSYNWGAGTTRIFTAASFIQNNMPLGQPGRLSDKQAWDVAYFINAHERPQDPRYTGDIEETRKQHNDFYQWSLYGQKINGKVLGDHNNTGEKPFLKPANLKPRTFD